MDNKCTLNELASLVDGEILGDGTITIWGFNGIEQAGEGEITFISSLKMAGALEKSSAAACIVPHELKGPALPAIRVEQPELAAAVIHAHLLSRPFQARGVHPSAVVGEECIINEAVSIGPLVALGDRVRIGPRVTLHPGVVVGDDSEIGEDTTVYANVSIGSRTIIGRRVILHACASIGSDGFGFATDRRSGKHFKKPQVGNVRIDDDVEIGANSCVDRAAFGTTRIRQGTKIDNLVMVAHNVDIGEDCILVGQVGIAGSATLGRNVILGGRAGIGGHIQVGDGCMVAGMSGVHTTLPAGSVVGGAPAMEVKRWGKATAVFARLPDMHKELRKLRKEVDRLQSQLACQTDRPEHEEE